MNPEKRQYDDDDVRTTGEMTTGKPVFIELTGALFLSDFRRSAEDAGWHWQLPNLRDEKWNPGRH